MLQETFFWLTPYAQNRKEPRGTRGPPGWLSRTTGPDDKSAGQASARLGGTQGQADRKAPPETFDRRTSAVTRADQEKAYSVTLQLG